MLRRPYLFLFLMGAILLASCNNDFDLIEEGDQLPVVYGFLDIGNDTQYLRIQKAFAGENLNAFEGAQIEDSVYFQNIDVRLVNTETNTSVTLDRVDAILDGYEREDGDFIKAPNILYRATTSDLGYQGGETVRLEIELGDDTEVVTSETFVLSPVELSTPPVGEAVNFAGNLQTWGIKNIDNVGIAGLNMIMYIREIDVQDPTKVEMVEVEWNMVNGAEVDSRNNFFFARYDSRLFYITLASQLDPNKPVIREFSHFDLILTAGGEEILEYRRIARANSGLTGAQELPLFSNLSKGIGIFSSKYNIRYQNFGIKPATRDSLARTPVLDGYNFVE